MKHSIDYTEFVDQLQTMKSPIIVEIVGSDSAEETLNQSEHIVIDAPIIDDCTSRTMTQSEHPLEVPAQDEGAKVVESTPTLWLLEKEAEATPLEDVVCAPINEEPFII